MKGDGIPRGLVGGGLRSASPTPLQMWLIQWAPGACLAAWPLAALVTRTDRATFASNLVFLAVGVTLGGVLWAVIALTSFPVFLALRPWIDRFVYPLARWRSVAFAAVAVTPLVGIALVVRVALSHQRTTSIADWLLSIGSCVPLIVGTFTAAEIWRTVLHSFQDTRHSPSTECIDLSFAVRVKEDLEVLRILLSNVAMGALCVVLLLLVPTFLVTVTVLLLRRPDMPSTASLISLIPLLVIAFLMLPLIVLASYQIGLWHFVSVRASGVLLFLGVCFLFAVHSLEPLQELYSGTRLGYTGKAWLYTGLLWLLTMPGFVVIGSILRMSLRLVRTGSELDPVVRGWRAWPNNIWAPALRALCMPSFLVSLPAGRLRAALVFALATIVSALHTGLFVGLAMKAPDFLTAIVRIELGDSDDAAGLAFPTLGAAITALAPGGLSTTFTPSGILLALPFVLVIFLFALGIWPTRRLTGWLLGRAQRRAARAYQRVMQQDVRSPVLFLRAFHGDQRLLEPCARSLIAKMLRLKDRKRTLDEIVLDAASPFGPVVALGAPDEKVAPLGAARLYADAADWQNAVRGLAERSRAIIICIDEGSGVLWELEDLLAHGHSTKMLCLFNSRTSQAAIHRAIEESRQSGNIPVCGLLERIRTHLSGVQPGKRLVGVRFGNDVAPIFAEDESDYTHWCTVNVMLAALN